MSGAPTSAVPATQVTAPATAVGTAPGSRLRVLLPTLIFALIGVVLAGGAAGLYLYDKATEPDRSTPTVSVDQFLEATLVDHSITAAQLYVCKGWSGDTGLTIMEGAVDPDVIRVTWDAPSIVHQEKTSARVQVRLRFRYPDDVSPSGESYWVFDVVDQGGWRVCGASPLLDPQ